MLSVIGCALLAAGALEARAQSTNVTLNVNIALTGVAPGDTKPTPVHIMTKDVIAAIGGSTSNSFSAKAKLLAVDNGSGGGPSFIIRDGTTDTVVPDGVLAVSQVGDAVSNTKTTTAGVISGSQTSIQHFVLTTDTLSFDVQGYTSESLSNRGRGPALLSDTPPVALNSKVNGTGSGGSVLQGTISASGRKVETTQ